MKLVIEHRESDSPWIAHVWRSSSDDVSLLVGVATVTWDLVMWRHRDTYHFNVQGPHTRASRMFIQEDAEFFGIMFRPGVTLAHLSPAVLLNNSLELPQGRCHSVWLNSSTYELPNFENAETFVARLVRDDALTRDPVVETVLRGEPTNHSVRSVQRRFLRTIGLNYRTIAQIERARNATRALIGGSPIADVVFEHGYSDQAHFTHALKRFIGQTPGQLINADTRETLSLLYKTDEAG